MTAQDPLAPPEFTDAQLRWLEEHFKPPSPIDLKLISSPDFAIHYAYGAGQASVPRRLRMAIDNMRAQRRSADGES